MANENGFIVLRRKMLDWEWFSDCKTLSVFIYLLLSVNWETTHFKGMEIPRGSVVTSYANIAKSTNLSVKSVRTALEHLKSTGEVTSKATNKYQVISVVNYAKYQDQQKQGGNQSGRQNGRQVAGKGQAKGRQRATSEQDKQEDSYIYKYIYSSSNQSTTRAREVVTDYLTDEQFQRLSDMCLSEGDFVKLCDRVNEVNPAHVSNAFQYCLAVGVNEGLFKETTDEQRENVSMR